MKNVLILSSSPRKNGNSDLLCKEFEKGAVEAGHNVTYVRLAEKKIGYCIGCYACQNSGKCFQNDDMADLLEVVKKADVIVFATPVYFYTMSAQLKTYIDRLTPCYEGIRADVYMIATAWDSNVENLKLTIESIRGLTRDCFEDCEEKGVLIAEGVHERGEIAERPEMHDAYLMGKNC